MACEKMVKRIQFGVMSPNEILETSVLEVSNESMLASARLGVPNMGECETCGGDSETCTGHFGHLSLALPIFHFGFLGAVLCILKCVCFSCSKLRLPQQDATWAQLQEAKTKKAKLTFLSKSSKDSSCRECKKPHVKFKRKGWRIRFQFHMESEWQPLFPDKAMEILQKISAEDCAKMGLNAKWCRPEWMILTHLPIPPPRVTHCDNLLHKLAQIIKVNETLRAHALAGTSEKSTNEFWYLLQLCIASYMFADIPEKAGVPPLGRPCKSFQERLRGKKGRIRGNLLGKTVNFSACSVVTPDPSIGIAEVAIPLSIAEKLTVPERVASFNFDRVRKLVQNGPKRYPGAKCIIRNGTRLDLCTSVKFEIGDVVERHLQDGDYVVLNRQPSLSRTSIMGHRVRVLPGATIRIHPSLCSAYNVDFDGDAMVLHVPQSLEAIAEVRELLAVPNHVLSPEHNGTTFGIIKDILTGSHMLTQRNVFIHKEFMMELLNCMGISTLPAPAILKPRPIWTGKQAFSLIFPKEINYSYYDGRDTWERQLKNDEHVEISNGTLLSGTLSKSMLMPQGHLVNLIAHQCGREALCEFVDKTNTVVNYWLTEHGLGFGIEDLIPHKWTVERIQRFKSRHGSREPLVPDHYSSWEEVLRRWNDNMYSYEVDLSSIVAGDLRMTCGLRSMVDSGTVLRKSVGKIITCVGIPNVQGNLIPRGFLHRTLPHFPKFEYSHASLGYSENSFLGGISPSEFFFHAMDARDAMVTSQMRTQEIGRIKRSLAKVTEDICVAYDRTVRNARGEILQFAYGEDGRDSAKLQFKTNQFAITRTNNPRYFTRAFCHWWEPWVTSSLAESVRLDYTDPSTRLALHEEEEALRKDQEMVRGMILTFISQVLPFSLARIIPNAQKRFRIDPARTRSDLHPVVIAHKVKQLCEKLGVLAFWQDDGASPFPSSPALSRYNPAHEPENETSLTLARMVVRNGLASKRVLCEYRLTSVAFEWVLREIEKSFLESAIQPGEMVGVIAAQCITPKNRPRYVARAGFACKEFPDVTIGIPRVKEILNASQGLRMPRATIYLRGSAARDSDCASSVIRRIAHVTLRKLLVSSEIYYDPNMDATCIDEDAELVQLYNELPDEDDAAHKWSPWLMRTELDKTTLEHYRISVAEVVDQLIKRYGMALQFMYSDDMADKVVIRTRVARDARVDESLRLGVACDEELRASDGTRDDAGLWVTKQVHDLILGTTISGIPGITKVMMAMEKNYTYSERDQEMKDEWVLTATMAPNTGCLFQLLREEDVDPTRTVSENPVEVAQVLGIEAARAVLLSQLYLLTSLDGTFTNYRHISLVADLMTHRGYIASTLSPPSLFRPAKPPLSSLPLSHPKSGKKPIYSPFSSSALPRDHPPACDFSGPLLRSSIGDPLPSLLTSSVFSECDTLKGVTERILLGQRTPTGTGIFDIFSIE